MAGIWLINMNFPYIIVKQGYVYCEIEYWNYIYPKFWTDAGVSVTVMNVSTPSPTEPGKRRLIIPDIQLNQLGIIMMMMMGWNTLDINVVHMNFGNSNTCIYNIFKEITYTTALATLVEINTMQKETS